MSDKISTVSKKDLMNVSATRKNIFPCKNDFKT